MKKILLITQSNCAGAERMTLLYAKILKENGFDCNILLTTSPKRPNTLNPFLPVDIPHYEIVAHHRLQIIYIAKFIYKLKPDIVFSSISVGNIIPLKKFLFPKLKVVFRLCNMPSSLSKHTHTINCKTLKHCTINIAQTDEMKEEMLSFYNLDNRHVYVINNPIDKWLINDGIKEMYPMDDHFINYIGVGKIIPRKGFDVLIKAFAKVKQIQPQSRLYIIGDYKDSYCKNTKEELDNIINELNIGDSVFMEGFQVNPFKYLMSSSVFVLSSYDEGLPNVMLEAMYLGKPVVATKCIPYINDVIKEGINGYSITVGDIDGMANAMIKAKNLKDLELFNDVNNSESKIISIFESI